MSLQTNLHDAFYRAGSEAKALRTLINGGTADLTALTTTSKTSLVSALNEIAGTVSDLSDEVAVASGIDDEVVSSSTKTRSVDWLNTNNVTLHAAIDAKEDTLTAGTSTQYYRGDKSWQTLDKATVGLGNVDNTTDAGKPVSTATQSALDGKAALSHTHTIANVTGLQTALDAKAAIDDSASTSTTETWSVDKIADEISSGISAVVGAAPSTLDTLNELAAALGDDANFSTTVTTALADRVRFDAAQTLTTGQKTQALANIGAIAVSDIGDPDTDFVAIFESALS